MISRWLYYARLGLLDLVRMWPTTQHHVIIVAGICLPILMLLGLKRGMVTELRRELLTSATGRQIMFWSARKGELMTADALDRIAGELPGVEVIIPEMQRVASLRSTAKDGVVREVESATLCSTRAPDPVLLQDGAILPAANDRALILSQRLASDLAVGVGDRIEVVLSRRQGARQESASLRMIVLSVVPTEEARSRLAYVDFHLLDRFEEYVRGFPVADFGWPAAKSSARDGYTSYLLFCEEGGDLTADDQRLLGERGFTVADCSTSPPEPLARLLTPEKHKRLRIYELSTDLSRTGQHPLYISPSELSQVTQADDVMLPWNKPLAAVVNGQHSTVIGLSLPRRTWLRQYFRVPQLAFDYDADPLSARTNGGINRPAALELSLRGSQTVGLKLVPPTPNATTREPAAGADDLVIVPANLGAWLAEYERGTVDYDSATRQFVALPSPPLYDKARLYAFSIDDVPAVARALNDRQFVVGSERARINEIHQQDRSLQLLVFVVGFGVFLFGIVTVISVLIDSTDRKRGAIGILRVMGMSPFGIFLSIFCRAGVIGLLAAALSVACGYLLGWILNWAPPAGSAIAAWKPVVSVQLSLHEFVVVATGAILCCGLGALLPGWRASRLDPFDAIVEGRFR